MPYRQETKGRLIKLLLTHKACLTYPSNFTFSVTDINDLKQPLLIKKSNSLLNIKHAKTFKQSLDDIRLY